MTGVWHPNGRARVSMRRPEAQAVCDRCYLNYSHSDLTFQFDWAGAKLQNKQILVCKTCLDIPQPQLRTIVIPPDPIPIANPRPENYAETVPSFVATESGTFSGSDITTESGDNIIWEIGNELLPDPNNPTFYFPDTASST